MTSAQENGSIGTRSLEELSVLVIEDDFYLADDVRQALEGAGARVIGPCPRFDPQKLRQSGKPDCAILDLNLGAGPEFGPAKIMLKQGVPVLFITGYDQTAIPAELSHVRYLQKPASAKKIITAVSELCGL